MNNRNSDGDRASALIRRLLTTAKADTVHGDPHLERVRRLARGHKATGG